MKTIYFFIFSLLFVATSSSQTLTRTFLFDCQYDATRYPSGGLWNDFFYTADQDIYDNTGTLGGHIKLSGWTQGNNLGTTTPTAPAINDFPTFTQVQDNIYGSVNPATILITGLNPNRTYTFTIFGSRASVADNREALYTIAGLNSGSATLNGSNNTGNVATISNIHPDAAGTLTFTAQPGANNNNGSKYFYLACFKMLEYDITSGIKNNALDNNIYYSNNSIYAENLSGVAKVYTATGIKVAEGQLINGTLSVKLESGVYVISVGNSSRKISVK